LEKGEHPFLEQQSYVFYAKSRQIAHVGIIKCAASGLYVPKESCDEAVLEKIRNGVTASAMTPRWAKGYFRLNSAR
jgi:hypothetical protein